MITTISNKKVKKKASGQWLSSSDPTAHRRFASPLSQPLSEQGGKSRSSTDVRPTIASDVTNHCPSESRQQQHQHQPKGKEYGEDNTTFEQGEEDEGQQQQEERRLLLDEEERYPIVQQLGFSDANVCVIHRNRFLVLQASRGPSGEPPNRNVPYRIAKAMGPLEMASDDDDDDDDENADRDDDDGSNGDDKDENDANDDEIEKGNWNGTEGRGADDARGTYKLMKSSRASISSRRLDSKCVHVMGYKLSGFKNSSSARWRCQHWTEIVPGRHVFGVVERLPKEAEVMQLGEYLRNVYNASINPDDLDEEKEPFNKKKNSGHQDYHDQNTATTSSKGGEGSSGKGVGERERMGNQTGDNPQAHSQDCPSDMINLHSSSAAAVEY